MKNEIMGKCRHSEKKKLHYLKTIVRNGDFINTKKIH